MNKEQYLKAIDQTEPNATRIQEISRTYATDLNETIIKVISYADKISFFDEERRALRYDEIINPAKNMDIDFTKLGLIPLIDNFENTYAVYIIAEKKWARFSSSDNCVYRKRDNFADVI